MSGAIQLGASQPLEAGAPSSAPVRSLLLIDCGSVFTKVAYIGQVNGQHRLIARGQATTTIGGTVNNVAQGVRAAIAEIERVTGQTFLRSGQLIQPEQQDGSGVDGAALSFSVGGPLRLLTAGPGRETLSALLYRSLGGLFVQLEALPPVSADLIAQNAEMQQLAPGILATNPHGVLVVGAPFAGARVQISIEDASQLVARWLDVLQGSSTTGERSNAHTLSVLFAGSQQDGQVVTAATQGHTPGVQLVDALSPSTLSPLTRATQQLYEFTVLRGLPGYDQLRALSAVPAVSTTTSLGGVARFLAQYYGMNVAAVDVGANATTLSGAAANGDFMPAEHPQAGVGPGGGAILRGTGAHNVLRWIPGPSDENEIVEHVLTRMVRPAAVPTTRRELEIEHALAREAIRLALLAQGSRLNGLRPIDIIYGTGGVLAHAPNPALAAMLLLDALQPQGITSLMIDTAQLATALGNAAQLVPELAASVASNDAVALLLGSVISTVGDMEEGQPAVRVVLEHMDGRQQVVDVLQGTMARLPLPRGERAILALYPAPQVDIGLGPGQQARGSEPVEGGVLGLIVDARGRPLALPTTSEARIARLLEWRRNMGLEA